MQDFFVHKTRKEQYTLVLLFIVLVIAFLLVIISLSIPRRVRAFIYTATAEVPETQVAIILGAGVKEDGRLSDMLMDRALVAVALYEAEKVGAILVSGDHGRKDYDEVNAVRQVLLQKGVPAEDIFLDHAGFDTYDSLYRAKAIFGIESATVVTQAFHLPRAVYIGRKLGIETVGQAADMQAYIHVNRLRMREVPARMKAVVNLALNTQPTFFGPAIPITGNGQVSWDEVH